MHKALTPLLQPEFSVHTALSGEEGLEKVETLVPDLILLDLIMSPMSGFEVLRRLTQSGGNIGNIGNMDIPVIIFTAYGRIDSAVRVMKMGAVDYIEKPFDNQKLKRIVRGSVRRREKVCELSIYREIIGESPQLKRVWQLVEKYGPADLPILIQGETGTGKELFAKAIHEISKRKKEAFVPLDCSAIPEALLESEIFGYEKGAFTGADGDKPGRLDWADEGTLFLDEVANLPLLYQAKLLRVIQERQYVPLGANKAKAVDVRFISASNVDLRQALQLGVFREDLYYRISGVCLELPPLRQREGDIELLTRYFIDKYARKYHRAALEISDEAMELLLSYKWPGNIRELEQTISTAVISAGRVLFPKHLPLNLQNLQRGVFVSNAGVRDQILEVKLQLSFSCDLAQPIDLKEFKRQAASETEKLIIAEIQKRFALNQTKLARFFSINPKTLRRRDKDKKII